MVERRLDITIADVMAAYGGAVGVLWEMVMGEEIHVGGGRETEELAAKTGVTAGDNVLDICSALGGPARHLATTIGCQVTGLDATPEMVAEASRRTGRAGLDGRVRFRLGNALDLPFKPGSYDVVWGQDAWCYVTDKTRLIKEAARVTRPGGKIGFTDWIQTSEMPDDEWGRLTSFMLFPSLETLEGYEALLDENGWMVSTVDDLSRDFSVHCKTYLEALQGRLRPQVIDSFGLDFYREVIDGITLWVNAAEKGKVGRGRWIGRRREI